MNRLSRFVLSMAKVGCMGFGGGSALIPVVEEEIINQQQLDTKKNYDQDVLVASITPGALPVEIAASLGKRNFGWTGMFLGALMMALPGALVTILLVTMLSTMQSGILHQITIASIGVSAFIMYLLTKYIVNVSKECYKESRARLKKAIFVMFVVFVLSSGKNVYKLLHIDAVPLFSVSTFHILMAAFFCILYTRGRYHVYNVCISFVLCLIYLLGYGKAGVIKDPMIIHVTEGIMIFLSLWGIVNNLRASGKKANVHKKVLVKDTGIWILIFLVAAIPAVCLSRGAFPFLRNGLVSALLSFGGGDAYLTVANGLFVDGGMITEHQFFGQIVPIVNILPGSILCKTLAAVGYDTGYNITGSVGAGILFAFAGFICSIAASCGFFFLIYHLYDSLTTLHVFRMISRWIRPIICGLLINIMFSLCNQSMAAAQMLSASAYQLLGITFLLYAVIMILGYRTKTKQMFLLVLATAVPFLLLR